MILSSQDHMTATRQVESATVRIEGALAKMADKRA